MTKRSIYSGPGAALLTVLLSSGMVNATDLTDIHDPLIKTETLEMRGTRELSRNTVRQVRMIDEERVIRTKALEFSNPTGNKP